MHKHLLFILLSILIACNSSTDKEQQTPEPGVSLALAEYRKSVIEELNYQLHFIIPAEVTEDIIGNEVISFHLKENAKDLPIDFKEDFSKLKQVVVNGKEIPIQHENEHMIIDKKHLQTGLNQVRIDFIAGNLSLNRNKEYLYTLLVPDRARTVFPVLDQPNLKATFDLKLTVPQGWIALSNGPLQDSISANDQITYQFGTSDKISTYLFSFAAGKFEQESRTINGVKMNFYHRETDEEKIRESLDSIFQIHTDALNFMEEYTQIPYPFQKFDFIALPGFQYGGMEHVGAIDYKASSLFLSASATQNQKISRASLIAHETAHMWFGDLVTMDWFNDVWMKEVFANFMADKITEITLETTNYDLKFLMSHFPASYGVDRTKGANPIRQKLDNLKDAGSLYGNIIYHKAPIMMRQLERLIGEEPFRKGLQEYLTTYAFENATWPQLIEILDEQTTVDLQAWNQVWVNEPGRPHFTYEMSYNSDNKNVIGITQSDPDQKNRLWPQVFEILLVYPDGTEELTVNMDSKDVEVALPDNDQSLDYVLFNSSGQGYGVFPVDSMMLESADNLYQLNDPLPRASAYINLYENMLEDRYIPANQLYMTLQEGLLQEGEELNLNLLTGYLANIYWKFIPEKKRNPEMLEEKLWQAMQQKSEPNQKKILFQTYQDIAISKNAQDKLYAIWENQQPPQGIKLSEEDYTDLALALAVRDYPEDILIIQQQRVKNPDRKDRLAFMMPALSANEAKRDAFFNSLKAEENRAKEAWVGTALSYLHHPLRTETSEKYLEESLLLLAEIQSTGDIFFPYRWLKSTFAYYNRDQAVEVVEAFLQKNHNYNPMLRAKILQATDDLYKANKMVRF